MSITVEQIKNVIVKHLDQDAVLSQLNNVMRSRSIPPDQALKIATYVAAWAASKGVVKHRLSHMQSMRIKQLPISKCITQATRITTIVTPNWLMLGNKSVRFLPKFVLSSPAVWVAVVV